MIRCLRALRRSRVSGAEVTALVESARPGILRVLDLVLDDEADLTRIYERRQQMVQGERSPGGHPADCI